MAQALLDFYRDLQPRKALTTVGLALSMTITPGRRHWLALWVTEMPVFATRPRQARQV